MSKKPGGREIGFWEHDIEASKMQGGARGRKGERKTYHITMEFGGYIYWMWQKNPRAQERKGEAQGVPPKKHPKEKPTAAARWVCAALREKTSWTTCCGRPSSNCYWDTGRMPNWPTYLKKRHVFFLTIIDRFWKRFLTTQMKDPIGFKTFLLPLFLVKIPQD